MANWMEIEQLKSNIVQYKLGIQQNEVRLQNAAGDPVATARIQATLAGQREDLAKAEAELRVAESQLKTSSTQESVVPVAASESQAPVNTQQYYLSEETFSEVEKKIAESTKATADLKLGVAEIPSFTGKAADEKTIINYLTNGISSEQANTMLANDIVKNEIAVKKSLSSLGLTKVPQNVFDGLVSMQNQLADISYAFVGGSKVDLTPFYKNGDWDKAASFMAADERDRPRRIREAAIIAGNDYGPDVVEESIIRQGLDNANELIAKEKLNQQTGEPATTQQIYAVSTNYLKETGRVVPRQSFPASVIADNKDLEELVKQSAGPWPY